LPHKKSRDYVNGPQLHKNILVWYESGEDEIPYNVFKPCMDICDRLGTKSNFNGYTYVDEMVDAAKILVIQALRNKKYNPYKFDNPFAYFTQVAWNEFRRILNVESKQSYIKHKSMMQYYLDMDLEGISINTAEDDNSGQIDKLMDKHEKVKK